MRLDRVCMELSCKHEKIITPAVTEMGCKQQGLMRGDR